MSDEAAAEVLLGVGRRHHRGSQLVDSPLKRDADQDVDEYDGMDDAHAQSRSRRSKRARTSRKRSSKKDNGEDEQGFDIKEDDTENANASSRGIVRTLSREAQSLAQAMQMHRDSDASMNEERYAQRGQICAPHGGLDLPPLNAALGLRNMHASGSYPGSTAPSSRAHSHSPTSFARTTLHGGPNAGVSLHLNPPPHSMLAHTHSMPAVPTASSGYRGGPIQLHPHPAAAPSPPESNIREGDMNPNLQRSRSSSAQHHHRLPSYQELELHYNQLYNERRRLEEMLERTDDMLSNVKRGMDQMRYAGLSAQGSTRSRSPAMHPPHQHHVPGQEPVLSGQQGPSSSSSGAMRLPSSHHHPNERRESSSIWPIEETRHHQN